MSSQLSKQLLADQQKKEKKERIVPSNFLPKDDMVWWEITVNAKISVDFFHKNVNVKVFKENYYVKR